MHLRVDCHAGYRGEETPRRLRLCDRTIEILTVCDRWLAPDHRYFKVLGDDDGIYIVRHDPHQLSWTLTFFQQGNQTMTLVPDDAPSRLII